MSYQHGPTAGSQPSGPSSWVPIPGQQPPPARMQRSRRWTLAAVAGIVVAVAVGVIVTRDDGPTRIERAAEAVDSPYIDLGDDGDTLIVALRDQPGTAGSDARDGLSLAQRPLAGEQDA